MTLYNNGDFYTGGVVSSTGGLYSTAACSFGSTLSVTGTATLGATTHSGTMTYAGIATGSGSTMVVVTTGSRVAYTTSSERFKQDIKYITSDGWLDKVVELVRRTRTHSDLRVGSSVRGAIDMAAVTVSLASVRSLTVLDAGVGLDAALVALSGRVRVREGSVRTAEDIITELWNEVFAPAPQGESGKASAPVGATH
jgi:hypothetical protein